MILYEFRDLDFYHIEHLILQEGVYFIYSEYLDYFEADIEKAGLSYEERDYYTFNSIYTEMGYRIVLLTYTPTNDAKFQIIIDEIEEEHLYGDDIETKLNYPIFEEIHHNVSADLDKFFDIIREHTAIDASVYHLIIYGIEREYHKLGDYEKAVDAFFQKEVIYKYITELGGTYSEDYYDDLKIGFCTKGEYETDFNWASRLEEFTDSK